MGSNNSIAHFKSSSSIGMEAGSNSNRQSTVWDKGASSSGSYMSRGEEGNQQMEPKSPQPNILGVLKHIIVITPHTPKIEILVRQHDYSCGDLLKQVLYIYFIPNPTCCFIYII